MAQDWAADVKKYVANADDEVISAIVKYCGIALHNQDSSLVSYSDPVELGRVRENFLKKKLGLTSSDADLDSGIAAVGERLKGVSFKNRVTVYYMLLEQFGMLDFFRKGGAAIAGAGAAAAAGAAALGLAGSGDDDKVAAAPAPAPAPAPEPAATTSYSAAAPLAAAGATAAAATAATASAAAETVAAAPSYAASSYDPDPVEEKSGMGWLWALLGLLALGLILWWLFFRGDAKPVETAAAPATEVAAPAVPAEGTAAPVADISMAPAEGTVEIPTGAGVTSEMRDGKPVVKVYFDTAKTDVAPAFAGAAAGLKAYLESHAGSTLAVSGYNDPRGNAAQNAELSKNRAQAVQADLVKAGIAEGSIELVKPEASTDTTVDNAGARRVEVVVR